MGGLSRNGMGWELRRDEGRGGEMMREATRESENKLER